MVGTDTDSKVVSAFGPTYIRATVGPRGLPTAAPSTSHGSSVLRVRVFRILGNVERITKSDQRGILRVVRNENRGEVLIGRSRPVEWHVERIAAANFLDGQPLDVAVVLIINLTGSVGRQRRFVSEPRRPRRESRDYTSAGND